MLAYYRLDSLAAEGFKRGLALQRSLRTPSCSNSSKSLSVKPAHNQTMFLLCIQLRICPMGHSKKGYIRVGDYVEVRVSKSASYAAVANHSIEVLQLEEEEEQVGEGEPSIFRVDGTVVPDCLVSDLPWTISRYLKSLNKSPGQLKLGVGFYYRVSV